MNVFRRDVWQYNISVLKDSTDSSDVYIWSAFIVQRGAVYSERVNNVFFCIFFCTIVVYRVMSRRRLLYIFYENVN